MFHFFHSSFAHFAQSQNSDSLVSKFCQSWGEMGAASPGNEQSREVWLLCATKTRRARADALTQPTISFENRQLPSISNSPPPIFQNSPEAEVFFIKGHLGIMCSPANLEKRLEIKDGGKDSMHQWPCCTGIVSQILDKGRKPWILLKNKNPPGYCPWLANEGRWERKILKMEHLSFDAGERMAPFRWSPAL